MPRPAGRRHAATFRAGDVVELELPMAPRVIWPDPRIDAVRGCVAIERGPEVLALESIDLAPLGVDDVGQVVIDADAPLDECGRPGRRHGCACGTRLSAEWPYGAADAATEGDGIPIPLVPYHSWANRGPSTMRVWIPTA